MYINQQSKYNEQKKDNIPSSLAYFIVYITRILSHFYEQEFEAKSKELLNHFITMFPPEIIPLFRERITFFCENEAKELMKLDIKHYNHLPLVIKLTESIIANATYGN